MIERDHFADAAVSAPQQVPVDDDSRPQALAGQKGDVVAAPERCPNVALRHGGKRRVVVDAHQGRPVQRVSKVGVHPPPETVGMPGGATPSVHRRGNPHGDREHVAA